MKSYLFGHLNGTTLPFRIPKSSFDTHWHLIGGTGKGKTTALHTILHGLFLDPTEEPCIIIIDRMGNLSWELLLWMASDFCTDDVRDRLVYIEPAREDVVVGFNPLIYDTAGHAYYRTARAAEIILRGWASQNLEEMPRLARWLFNSFYACALLGLTIADSVHLVLPRSDIHKRLLACLPDQLKHEWQDIMGTSPNEVSRILESTRNRLKPFYDAPILRRMFGATTNRLDMLRFMREGKIVLLNLAPGNRIPQQVADAIGGLVINEVLTTARSLPFGVRYPTYLFLDEFQRFVGPDIEAAIPEVRQLEIKLLLSHQSLAQLVQGDCDLTSLIFQAQSRMIFGIQGEDADLLAHELASLQFDPYKIKDELYSRRQRLSGHRIMELQSWGSAEAHAQNWLKTYGESWSYRPTAPLSNPYQNLHRTYNDGRSSGDSRSDSSSRGTHEQLVPIHEDFMELMNRTYVTFDEEKQVWARDLRRLPRGRALIRLVDEPRLFDVAVKRSAPGHLAFHSKKLAEEFPDMIEGVHALIERNFQSDLFSTPEAIDAESRERLTRVLQGNGVPSAIAPPSDRTPFSS